MPVIPAIWEAEAGESLEPGRQRLQWAEIEPLHSSLGNKSKTPSQEKKKKEKKGESSLTGGAEFGNRVLEETGWEIWFWKTKSLGCSPSTAITCWGDLGQAVQPLWA